MTSPMAFGNPWHGRLRSDGLVVTGEVLVTSVLGLGASGAPVSIPYVAPGFLESLGHTYYYKQPGIAAAQTPAAVAALGGEFKNDAIFFGSKRRYSPFNSTGMLGKYEWLHFGADGKWRRLSLRTVSVGGMATVVEILSGAQFGVLNKEVPTTETLIAQLTLVGRSCSDPALSEIDVRHDGQQIVICLIGKWANALDAESETPGNVIFNNATIGAIAAAWRIDVSADLLSASATALWVAEDREIENTGEPSWMEPTGPVVFSDSGGVRYFFQPVYEKSTVYGGSVFSMERLIGSAFSADGALHLIKLKYRRERAFQWLEEWGFVSRGSVLLPSSYVPGGVVASGVLAPLVRDDTNWPVTSIMHNDPPPYTYVRDVVSNSVTLKTISGNSASALHAEALTNNTFDLRDSAQSLCRLGPGCIDDTTMTGSVFGAFNPRTGTVHSSGSAIGFV